jgi:hypothetical protein
MPTAGFRRERTTRPRRPARAIVAKLIVPAEIMAELAQMIAADRPETVSAFARLPVDAVAH